MCCVTILCSDWEFMVLLTGGVGKSMIDISMATIPVSPFADYGNNTLLGSTGDARLIGCAVDDMLYGGTGRDQLNGDDGNDTVCGQGSRGEAARTA